MFRTCFQENSSFGPRRIIRMMVNLIDPKILIHEKSNRHKTCALIAGQYVMPVGPKNIEKPDSYWET
jgi:hypothetical protein